MTQPEIQGQSVPDAESLAYEAAAVAAVTGAVAASVLAALAAAATALGLGASGMLLGQVLADKLRRVHVPDMSGVLSTWTAGAVRLGVRTALEDMDRTDLDVSMSEPPVRTDLDTIIRTKLDEAATIAESGQVSTRTDLERVSGRARSGIARAEGAVRYSVNHGINSGTADAARAAGMRTIWVAERHACLHCLAYAGWATEPDGEFPPGLTYDPAGPLRPFGPLLWPPLHPNCRCRIRAYDGPAGPPPRDRAKPDPAARLASEAQRTVVYGWSDYASKVASERAARALLDHGTTLADSVEKRARAALRRGRAVRRPK